MSKCGKCCGRCGGCSGGALELTAGEIDMLQKLSQIPFLPVVRDTDDTTPIYPESTDETAGLILQCLEKKELISIDYDAPLKGYNTPAYDAYSVRGSFALTERGQQVLELLDIQGIEE